MNNRDKRLEYSGVVRPVCSYINSIPGCKAINVHGGVFSERGTPDIIGSIRGRAIAFECKRSEGEAPELIQEWRLAEWRAAGAITAVIGSVTQVRELIREYIDE